MRYNERAAAEILPLNSNCKVLRHASECMSRSVCPSAEGQKGRWKKEEGRKKNEERGGAENGDGLSLRAQPDKDLFFEGNVVPSSRVLPRAWTSFPRDRQKSFKSWRMTRIHDSALK